MIIIAATFCITACLSIVQSSNKMKPSNSHISSMYFFCFLFASLFAPETFASNNSSGQLLVYPNVWYTLGRTLIHYKCLLINEVHKKKLLRRNCFELQNAEKILLFFNGASTACVYSSTRIFFIISQDIQGVHIQRFFSLSWMTNKGLNSLNLPSQIISRMNIYLSKSEKKLFNTISQNKLT